MKSILSSSFVLAAVLVVAQHARADNTFVYGSVGSGMAIGVGQVLNDSFSIRADIGHQPDFSYHRNLGGNDYSVQPDATTKANIMLDWFPITGSGFHVSGGLGYTNDPTQVSTALPNGSGDYQINGKSYGASSVGQLRATSTFNKFAPEIGIGWDSAPANKPGWRLTTGLNLALLSGGHTSLAATDETAGGTFTTDLAAEQSAVNSDFGNRRAQLNLSLGVAYTF